MAVKKNIQDALNQWEYYTLKADSRYHQGEYKQASQLFSRSVDLLEPWIEKESEGKQLWKVIRLFVIACHNTGHALNRHGRHKEAEYYYSHAHFRLLSLISGNQYPKRFMEKALHELRSTFLQLSDFLLRENKIELAASVKEESIRVVRQHHSEGWREVFVV